MAPLLADKYFPKNFDEFIGNVEIVDFARAWAEKWQSGKKQKPLFLFGQSGAGKTCLAYLLAKQMGWQVFEMNASDLRNKESIESVAGAAAGNSSLFGGKRLILLDEVDAMQSQDRGGASAIASIIKDSNNPVILTANDLYGDKKLLPLRSICELKEFKKINYLSISKRLNEIAEIEKIGSEEGAIKELAKNSGGDFRSALLDLESLAPKVMLKEVQEIFPRQRKEKVFSVLTKIFKGHDAKEIQDVVWNSEIASDLLMRWIEENIPRQFDPADSALAFESLSKADVFNGRIFRRQDYGFLKYSSFLATAGVGLARKKDYHSWIPFQFPSLLTDLSASSGKRETTKSVASKIGAKMHCSRKQAMKDLPFIKVLFESKQMAPWLVHYFDLEEKEIAFLLGKKPDSKLVENLVEESSKIVKQIVLDRAHGNQQTLFGQSA